MEIKHRLSREDYIDQLDIASNFDPNDLEDNYPDKVLSFTSQQNSAKSVDGSVVSFLAGLSQQQQQDVLDSTLLAQLAANKAFDREKETPQWYGKYREVLENIGWVIQSFTFTQFHSAQQHFTMDKAVLSILQAALSGNELAILAATIKALGDSNQNKNAISIFENGGSHGPSGNFQLSQASLDGNGSVSMSLGANYFETKKHQTHFLFFKFSSKEINFYTGVQRVNLNEQIYATVRSQIAQKLGKKAKQFVGDLAI